MNARSQRISRGLYAFERSGAASMVYSVRRHRRARMIELVLQADVHRSIAAVRSARSI